MKKYDGILQSILLFTCQFVISTIRRPPLDRSNEKIRNFVRYWSLCQSGLNDLFTTTSVLPTVDSVPQYKFCATWDKSYPNEAWNTEVNPQIHCTAYISVISTETSTTCDLNYGIDSFES